MTYVTSSGGSTAGLEIVLSNFEYLQEAITNVKYADIFWPQFIPTASIDGSVNPGATVASYRVRDRRGRGAFRSKYGDVPTVGMSLDKVSVQLEPSGVMAQFDTQDEREYIYAFGNNSGGDGFTGSIFEDFAQIMREASERHIEGTFFFGSVPHNYNGWIDYPNVPLINAPNGAGGNPEWTTKTPEEILADVNTVLTTVWQNSQMVHLPDTIYLPPVRYGYIANQIVSTAGNISILEYIKQNNIYTAQTGNLLNVQPALYLDQAGVGGAQRMRAVEFKPSNYWMPMPLPLTMLDPQPVGFGINLLAEYIFGPLHIKFPVSQINMDDI